MIMARRNITELTVAPNKNPKIVSYVPKYHSLTMKDKLCDPNNFIKGIVIFVLDSNLSSISGVSTPGPTRACAQVNLTCALVNFISFE